MDFGDDKNLDKYINSILNLKGNWDLIYMEDYNLKLYRHIESILNLNFPKGRNLRLYNIVMILNETIEYKEDKYGKEVLIICEEIDLACEIIKFISYNFKFISLIGMDKDKSEELHNHIFEDIGITIFLAKDIKNVLRNTGIIINFNEEINEELINQLGKLNKDTVVIDFSVGKPLKHFVDIEVILDVSFNIPEDISNTNPLILKEASSMLYEALFQNRIRKFDRISKNQEISPKYKQTNEIKLKGSL